MGGGSAIWTVGTSTNLRRNYVGFERSVMCVCVFLDVP